MKLKKVYWLSREERMLARSPRMLVAVVVLAKMMEQPARAHLRENADCKLHSARGVTPGPRQTRRA
jgi:hypothetical protein